MTTHSRSVPVARAAHSVTVAMLGGALLGAGCAPSDGMFRPVRATTMREAGSVHLTVLSVAPWRDYVAALQPDFNLSADEALAQVAADSRWMIEDAAKAVGLGREPVIVDQRDGQDVSGVSAIPRREPPAGAYGGWPEAYERLGQANIMPEGDAPPATGPDAMLKYTAATALFQEVQLLNRYIQDAAIPDGFRPYVVRLQISLMPSRRHAPYDAYMTISFFIPGDGQPPSEPAEGRPAYSLLDSRRPVLEEPFGNGPKILPLLVTDNLEASVQSRSLDTILSLYAGSLNFKETGFVEPLYEALLSDTIRTEVYGRDLNSLLTLARLSENTLRIRLGAMQETTANYAMVPRNHNITLLLMVPEGAPPLMEVVSKTVLVDATTGESLSGSIGTDAAALARQLKREWRARDLGTDTLERLVAMAQGNDQRGFTALLRSRLPDDHPILQQERAFWIELVSFMIGNEYNSHLFELPGQGEDVVESSQVFHMQTVVAEDDGESIRIVLREARFPDFERILALLTLTQDEPDSMIFEEDEGEYEPAEMDDETEPDEMFEETEPGGGLADSPSEEPPAESPGMVLLAQSVEIDNSRRELRLEFPSLTRLQLVEGDLATSPFQLRLSWAGETVVFDVIHREVSPIDP